MKINKSLFSLFLALWLIFGMSFTAFATSYAETDVKPGLSGIQPSDSLTLPNNADAATLTATWGVRVTFVDWDERELKTEIVSVTDTTPGSTMSPIQPTRSGYTFTGWERHDTTSGTATLNGDGSVTDVNGPGPIVFIAKYTNNSTSNPGFPNNTGDNSKLLLWVIFLAASGAVLIGTIIYNNKKKIN